eukprot:2905055-Amphidinium_carterae.1
MQACGSKCLPLDSQTPSQRVSVIRGKAAKVCPGTIIFLIFAVKASIGERPIGMILLFAPMAMPVASSSTTKATERTSSSFGVRAPAIMSSAYRTHLATGSGHGTCAEANRTNGSTARANANPDQ